MPKENEFKGPTVMYGPGGESRVFTNSADVPDGWADNPKDAVVAAPKAPLPPALSREEIIAALEGGGISYKKQASTPALYAQLTENVKAHLTKNGVAFDPDADTKQLLALLAPAE